MSADGPPGCALLCVTHAACDVSYRGAGFACLADIDSPVRQAAKAKSSNSSSKPAAKHKSSQDVPDDVEDARPKHKAAPKRAKPAARDGDDDDEDAPVKAASKKPTKPAAKAAPSPAKVERARVCACVVSSILIRARTAQGCAGARWRQRRGGQTSRQTSCQTIVKGVYNVACVDMCVCVWLAR